MILFNILFCTILLSTEKSETTLYGTEILKGKVSSIVMTDNYRCDSIVFSYDSDNQVTGYRIFENGKPGGHCEYSYSTNGIEQSCYDYNGKQLSCLCIEFDTNHKTTMQQYGYVYPDTANIKLLYKKAFHTMPETRNQMLTSIFVMAYHRINTDTPTILTVQ